jgi:transcriptional regulator with XRE-family HTH domain
MADARLTERQLAERIGADPKTVGRWARDEGQLPQQRLRWAVSECLGVDEVALWPAAARAALKTGPDREVLAVYPTHSAVPATVWQRLVIDASREIMFCGTLHYWYWYEVPDLSAVLRSKAESGCRVRVVIGDPADPLVQADEEATGVPLTLSSRIEQTRHLLEPLHDVVQVRQTALGFGRSVFRGDDTAAAHYWVHGAMGADIPVFHLRRRQAGGIFDQIAVRHAEALWASAAPVWPSG